MKFCSTTTFRIMGSCNKKCGTIVVFTVGTILIALGLLIALFWGSIYDTILKEELVLTNKSKSYDLWKETPIPMYLSLYLYNWTNSDKVLKSKWAVKPELQECGPYVFSEHHIRVNMIWNSNGTVTYQQKRIWHFIPELSNGSLSDNITNLNPVVATVGNKLKSIDSTIAREAVNLALRGFEHSLVITKTVDELLFKGYDDAVLRIISKLKQKGMNIPFDKFGWFYSRNNSEIYDGTFTIYTGKTGLELIGVMDLWNGEKSTSDYESYCNYVNGTSGELWPPVGNYQQVAIFSSDVCSSIAIEYKDDEVIGGVTGRKYVGTDYAFDNGTKYPDQACFHGDNVVPSGTRNIANCRFGVPIYISYPHFYLADPSYRDSVKGMHPNKTEHEMYVALEPNTGIPLDVRAQMQINLFIEPIKHMSMFDNIKPTYMPMLWFRQSATLTTKYTTMVKVLLVLNNVGVYVGWSLFGIGIFLAMVGIFMVLRKDWKDREAEHLLEDEDEQE